MIDIKAKNEDGAVTMRFEVSGKRIDIIKEFAAIMLEVPKQLCNSDPELFRAASEEFRAQMDSFQTEIIEREVEVDNGSKQN